MWNRVTEIEDRKVLKNAIAGEKWGTNREQKLKIFTFRLSKRAESDLRFYLR